MKIDTPLGDIVDRYSILTIKKQRISHQNAQKNILREAEAIREAWKQSSHPPMQELPQWSELLAVNLRLWEVEDLLRECEKRQTFDEAFITMARSVYTLNDHRASLKRSINLFLGSDLMEEKSYAP